jgi:hypothetical protein
MKKVTLSTKLNISPKTADFILKELIKLEKKEKIDYSNRNYRW